MSVHTVFMANGMINSFSFASKSDRGFSPEDFALLRAVFPAAAACQEILTAHRILRDVMRMYVCDEPHRRTLSGDVHRGEVMHIRSAIFFADMRRFAEPTADMTAEQATGLLDRYSDCVVPHVEQNGGEVLKFMGDGILAIFRAEDEGYEARGRADRASRQALCTVADSNRDQAASFEIGIALHFGEVAYGNVGSGTRLDYTVIGRDVNIASRIAALCGQLGEPLLTTEAFGRRCRNDGMISLGRKPLKGITDDQEIFAPKTDHS